MRIRRPLVAVLTAAVLIALQAIADPTGLLALVGWPGGTPRVDLWWPIARYVVFVPVMLGMLWWGAVRTGGRFWTMTAVGTLSVLIAQAATVLAMTLDPLLAGWAAGYVTAKAVPAALIIAAVTRLAGGRPVKGGRQSSSARNRRGSSPAQPASGETGASRAPASGETGASGASAVPVWPAAITVAALAPVLGGSWWTGGAYAPLLPAPRVEHGVVLLTAGVALLAIAAWLGIRWCRRRVPGFLGTWAGAMVGGGLFGLVLALLALIVDNGFTGELAPLLNAYIFIADGMSFGAAVGWIAAVVALLADRVRTRPIAGADESAARRSDVADTPRDAHISAGSARRTSARPVSVVAGAAVLAVAVTAGTMLHPPVQRAEADDVPAGFLRVEDGRIADGEGNQVLLRGVNVNQLVDFYQARPEVPATRPLTEQDYADMAALGFDVVRLNISWSALEPKQGSLDPTYLGKIEEAVGWGKAHGIRTVLDMHQDGWSNAPTQPGDVCRPGIDPMWGYDGAPAWATQFDGTPRCSFTGRDISPAGDRAFEHFWFDTDGIQSALVRTWGELAGVFADEPAVAGFDLLNEPGFGETAPVTTSAQLGRFWSRAIDAIREAGAPQIVFVEPSILWSGLGIDSGPALGFTADANVVFSPHLYAESITMDHSLGLPTIIGIERQFEAAQRVADEHDMILWSGEYGYWGDDASIRERMTRYAAEEDRRMLGSAYWVWKQSCGDPQNGIGPLGLALVPEDCKTGENAPGNEDLLRLLSRAYPQSAPGRITSLASAETGADGRLALSGTTPEHGCGLRVWVPGTAEPEVTKSTGLTDIASEQVDGGWMLTGCASGEYAMRIR
ncbi:cellulase family glycosylhydrolase [Microbacterium sp. NPDC057650]|uniref:cellulase family glycosylhydrolase n=1 Tax=unclassified Microbacterium TaxID=2609290 RepID=UPI00366D769A